MIYEVLKVLRDELDEALNHEPEVPIADQVAIVIDDIAKDDNDATAISNKIVITLLNVEEELTLKNNPRYERIERIKPEGNVKGYIKKNPSAYLNLYVMVAANRDKYEKSLANLSKVIETFQTKKVLFNEDENLRFKVQLHPLDFDKLSYAWGLLGGKVIPSALYKVSIIKIQKEGDPVDVELITDFKIKSDKKKPNENIN